MNNIISTVRSIYKYILKYLIPINNKYLLFIHCIFYLHTHALAIILKTKTLF